MDVTLYLVGVEHMQRAAIGEGDVVGDVHQRRNRAKPNGPEAALQPLGRGAVLDTLDIAPDEQRAGPAVASGEVERHGDGRIEAAADLRRIEWLEAAQTLRSEVTRDAVDAERIRAVGCYLHIDHRVIQPQGPGRRRADGPVAFNFDDAVMFLRNQQFALRAHHAFGGLAADHALFQRDLGARHISARKCDDRLDARAGVGRATHDLNEASIRFHLAQAQLVGVRMFVRMLNIANLEGRQRLRHVGDVFDFEANADQPLADFLEGGGGIEIVLQPGEREFHDRPPASVGTCSALNP